MGAAPPGVSALCDTLALVNSPTVRALIGVREVELSTLQILPATSLVLAVSGAPSRAVTLDGKQRWLTGTNPGLLAMDLARSTGFHRMQVGRNVFWFGTEDAKLGLDGVEAMLAEMRSLGTGWTGQALFSDGAGLRDAHVVYGWLDQWADSALRAVEAILAAPRTTVTRTKRVSRRGGARVLVPATVQLLRSDPRRHLAPSAGEGVFTFGGAGYDPLRVVVKHRRTTVDTLANRRAASLPPSVIRLCDEVLRDNPDQQTTTRCRMWRTRAETIQRRPLAAQLSAAPVVGMAPRQPEELVDARYRVSYEIASDFRRGFGWSATRRIESRFSYVDRSDLIYQAYTASCLALALGMTQTSSVLGMEPVAFTSERFDLYYDRHPPDHVLRSWRSGGSRPDVSRPDLLLHERSSGKVAVLDAKYRVADDGGATEDSRKDMEAYLNLYGLHAATILFPGEAGSAAAVTGRDFTLNEVPVAPAADVGVALPSILATLELPPYLAD